MERPRYLDVFRGIGMTLIVLLDLIGIIFRGIGMVSIVRLDLIGIIFRKIGQAVRKTKICLSIQSASSESWKCDSCGAIGRGDASSFFSLDEVEHFLGTGCRGSLRRHAVPELAVLSHSREENRTPVQDTTTCLSRASSLISS